MHNRDDVEEEVWQIKVVDDNVRYARQPEDESDGGEGDVSETMVVVTFCLHRDARQFPGRVIVKLVEVSAKRHQVDM